MAQKLDDLKAVRTLVQALEGFEKSDQERIIRWTREKLGFVILPPVAPLRQPHDPNAPAGVKKDSDKGKDIKTFISEKNPKSGNQFAVTVAYYYKFEAPEDQRKDAITSKDLQEACRTAGRHRLKYPAQTLVNTHNLGLLNKAGEPGTYSINTVGENLVAMTLPGKSSEVSRKKAVIKKKRNKKIIAASKSNRVKAGNPNRKR